MKALAALAMLVVGMGLGVAVTLLAYHQGRQATRIDPDALERGHGGTDGPRPEGDARPPAGIDHL